MDPKADCNNEQEGPDAVTQTMPSQLMAASGAEPIAMEYEAWRVLLLRSVCVARQFRRRFGHPPGAHGGWIRSDTAGCVSSLL